MTERPSSPTAELLRALPERDLIRRAQEGSRASYGELVERFQDRLLGFLRRRCGSVADAEDLAQETFVRAWQHLDRYDDRWRFSTWLFTIAGRLAISHGRREGGRRARTIDAASAAPAGADPVARTADREQGARLWDLADRLLSDTQRSALWLRYAEDLPPRTIARILGKSQIGVRVLLFRARETLAARLDAPLDVRLDLRLDLPLDPPTRRDAPNPARPRGARPSSAPTTIPAPAPAPGGAS